VQRWILWNPEVTDFGRIPFGKVVSMQDSFVFLMNINHNRSVCSSRVKGEFGWWKMLIQIIQFDPSEMTGFFEKSCHAIDSSAGLQYAWAEPCYSGGMTEFEQDNSSEMSRDHANCTKHIMKITILIHSPQIRCPAHHVPDQRVVCRSRLSSVATR
jgi:hypothetical protein